MRILYWLYENFTNIIEKFKVVSFDNLAINQLNVRRLMSADEWRAVGGNPACRGYDNFIKRHNGTKHILKDSIKDKNSKYHDDIIYEIVSS